MSQKTRSMVLVMALVGVLLLVSGQPVLAADNQGKTIITPMSLQLIYYTTSSIGPYGTTIYVEGTTGTYYDVDRISTTVYLERWTGSYWTTVRSWSNSVYNDWYCTVSGSYTGVSGYTYRVRCSHQAQDGSTYETCYTYTGSITL